MVKDHQDNGLAFSTRIPRADAGKHACAAQMGQVVASPFGNVSGKAQESARRYLNNPRPSVDGLARVCSSRDAPLTGGGLSNRPQSFSLQSGDALSHKLASSFPSHSQIASSGVKP